MTTKAAEHNKKKRLKWLAEGKCGRCGKENDRPHLTSCTQCYAYSQELRSRKVAKGVCWQCQKPVVPGKKQCVLCKKASAAYKKNRVIKGQCVNCGKPRDFHTNTCKECTDKFEASRIARDLRLKQEVMDNYGGKCACCGTDKLVVLTIDHLADNGAEHRKNSKVGTGGKFYRWLRKSKYPEGYQVLCFSCNSAKYILKRMPTPSDVLPTATVEYASIDLTMAA